MFTKSLLIFLVVCCLVSLGISQTMLLTTKGISPREAAFDTTDIFDRAYNGLLNVGVETQMYLVGKLKGASLTNPTWTVTGPTGSVVTITTTTDIDTSTHVAVFTPDVVGTYIVDFADGEYAASITINAGTYIGIEDGNCILCHSEKVSEWEDTGHYSIFQTKLTTPGYYAERCISCHTTGYDTYANNDGFDDFEFVFPDSFYPGQWDTLLAKYPEAMKRARIQCESCHGPASSHNGITSDSKMVSSMNTSNCATCHDAGTHHVYPAQWRVSGHSNPPAYPASRSSCVRCHTGSGFVEYLEGVAEPSPGYNPISCAACHDPHSDAKAHQLRTVQATLANGVEVTEGGSGKLCMNCHQGRRDASTYTEAPHRHYGPHYVPQADMLNATNAITFGKTLPTSPHISVIENSCVECHMAEGHTDEEGNVILVGSHTFSVIDTAGVDNVAICEGCHGNIGESFAEKKYYYNGNADHDGDGVKEGLQEEVRGLLETLAKMLPHKDGAEEYSPHDDPDSTWTKTELKAAFNYDYVYYDHSYGIHNPAYTVALLKVSIQALINNAIEGEIVAIEDVPNDQGKKIRIIWDKFVDDGIAVDPIATYLVKRLDGQDDWTGVGQYIAHGAQRYALVVPTLYDSTAEGNALTTFKVIAISRNGVVHESLPGMGYSVDNLVPHAPGNLMALTTAGNVELSWEAPDDPDINYYRIYRAAEEDFMPDESTEIGNTVDLTFVDEDPGIGTWYYKVAAVDFSGNLGDSSPSVNATLTSVDNENVVPTNFELSQNYPNPFNPKTTINFSLLESGHVNLEIFNARGQRIQILVDKDMNAGNHSVNFLGDKLSSGIYIYRIKFISTKGNGVQFQDMKKMILMK